jgi:hypothetical protein
LWGKTRYFEEKSLKTGNFTCSLEYGTALTTILLILLLYLNTVTVTAGVFWATSHIFSTLCQQKNFKKLKFVNIIYEMSVFLNTVVEALKQISDFFCLYFIYRVKTREIIHNQAQ